MILAAGANHLREAVQIFATPSTSRGVLAVIIDYAMYLACIVLAVTSASAWLQLLFALLAGQIIACLFVLAHDAAHGSLTRSSRLNRLLAYLSFLPALTNYTLWRLQHNRVHHRRPNLAAINSWAPLSPAEYRALPGWRRALERFYRCGLGFGAYYLVHRWWKDKFFPRRASLKVSPAFHRAALRDFCVLIGALLLYVAALVIFAQHYAHDPSPWRALLFGLVIPFLTWNYVVATTIYLQHTHVRVPWYRSSDASYAGAGQEHVTVSISYARWYGVFTHDIM